MERPRCVRKNEQNFPSYVTFLFHSISGIGFFLRRMPIFYQTSSYLVIALCYCNLF